MGHFEAGEEVDIIYGAQKNLKDKSYVWNSFSPNATSASSTYLLYLFPGIASCS